MTLSHFLKLCLVSTAIGTTFCPLVRAASHVDSPHDHTESSAPEAGYACGSRPMVSGFSLTASGTAMPNPCPLFDILGYW